MQAAEAKVQKVLEGSKQFLVPHYQRPYSWHKPQWDILWRDVEELVENPESKPHFLGSVVTAPAGSVPEGVEKRLLIDGQQRLTTLFVLLAQVRDKAIASGAPKLADKIKDLILNRHDEGNDHYKLLPTQGDSAAESDRVAFLAAMDGVACASVSAISGVRGYFSAKLNQYDVAALDELFRTISGKLTIVSIILDEKDNPHRIFESLNGKGRPLSQVDLIRNYFFMRLPNEDHERVYRELWQPMQAHLGEERLTGFVRHYLMHFGNQVNEADVYATLKERVESSQSPVLGHLRELVELAKYYALFDDPQGAPPAIAERLARLSRLDVTVSYPFLLPTYADFARGELSEAHLGEVLDVVETYVMRRFVCGLSTNALGKTFVPLYKKAKREADFLAAVKAGLACPGDRVFREQLVSARLYRGGDRRDKVKLLLERIEAAFGHKERIDPSNLTIEHIMPQTLTPAWQRQLGDNWEDDHEELLHTLGNLTLTGYNSELSNAPFAEKRKTLVGSHFVLNRYFVDVETWDAKQIEARAEALADVAISIWPQFGDAEPFVEAFADADDDGDDDNDGGVTGTLPRAVTFRGKTLPVHSWVEVLLVTFEEIIAMGEGAFEAVAPKLSRWLSRDPNKFRRARRLKALSNGAFIETNLSARSVYRVCKRATSILGLHQDGWGVERLALGQREAATAEGEGREVGDTRELQGEFWKALTPKLMASGQFAGIRAVRPQYWFDLALGRAGFWLSLTANMRDGLAGVKLMVKAEDHPAGLSALSLQRAAIEQEVGAELAWDLNPEKKHRSICLTRAFDIADQAAWPAATDWLCTTACAFRAAFAARIAELP